MKILLAIGYLNYSEIKFKFCFCLRIWVDELKRRSHTVQTDINSTREDKYEFKERKKRKEKKRKEKKRKEKKRKNIFYYTFHPSQKSLHQEFQANFLQNSLIVQLPKIRIETINRYLYVNKFKKPLGPER